MEITQEKTETLDAQELLEKAGEKALVTSRYGVLTHNELMHLITNYSIVLEQLAEKVGLDLKETLTGKENEE